jgi:hypothetical protein
MMIVNNSHLSYCTNIHPGESWATVFKSLEDYCLQVKKSVAPHQSFGIGLRLSCQAASELLQQDHLSLFKKWLSENDCYVFTMNGFPYGNFHGQAVKDQVHAPDWTNRERLIYTIRLFDILTALLPPGMEGGISTAPLSYKYWHQTESDTLRVKQSATKHLMELVAYLVHIHQSTGAQLHLDIEPEPDGLLENSDEYIAFFKDFLLEEGARQLVITLSCSMEQAKEYIRYHIQLCYDICHFAVGYEAAEAVIKKMEDHQLRVGKIQISAALKCSVNSTVSIAEQQLCLGAFDEPVYLHQAVIQTTEGTLLKFRDLGEGIQAMIRPDFRELRTHFHVPVFVAAYKELTSTQSDITDTLQRWCEKPFTPHLEVETYTWHILPEYLQTNITASIVRELNWVINLINKSSNQAAGLKNSQAPL